MACQVLEQSPDIAALLAQFHQLPPLRQNSLCQFRTSYFVGFDGQEERGVLWCLIVIDFDPYHTVHGREQIDNRGRLGTTKCELTRSCPVEVLACHWRRFGPH